MMAGTLVFASSYSSCMLFVSRLTLTSFVPSTFATAFSTRAEQAEHVMPVIVNCSFFILDFSLLGGYWETTGHFMTFWSVATSSSTTHDLMCCASSSLLNALSADWMALTCVRMSTQ